LKVLITGSRGYIGSVLAKTLSEQGIIPFGIDHNGRPDGSTIYGLYQEACITDDEVIEVVMHLGIDTIFHLAASADVGDSVINPAPFYYNNIGRTSLMMTKLLARGWRGKVVFSSTAAVYEPSMYIINENDAKNSPNPYGRSKLACEELLFDIYKAHKIPTVVFRYFNVAGAWDDVGDHIDANHIVSRMCKTAYERSPFTIFGTNKETRDGTCVRDYLHVRDVCDAHLHAAGYLDIDPGFHTFNLGTGIGITNKEMVRAFERFTAQKLEVINGQGRPGDPDILFASPLKFTNITGYRYKHSSLENIISTAWQYYCNKME
jgi:UDP-glucose 4-epimerase